MASSPPPKYSPISKMPAPIDFNAASEEEASANVAAFASFIEERSVGGRAQGTEDLRAIVSTWGSNLVRLALRAGNAADRGTGKQVVIPRRAYVLLSQYTKRSLVSMRPHQPGLSGMAAGIDLHKALVAEYLDEDVVPLVREARGEQLLLQLIKQWELHKIFTEWMRRLFLAIDNADAEDKRLYSSEKGLKYRSTTAAGLLLYRDRVFAGQSRHITSEISALVDRDREGETVDRSLLKSIAELYTLMGLVGSDAYRELKDRKAVVAIALEESSAIGNDTYRQGFEIPFCLHAAEYFGAKADDWFASDSVTTFVNKVRVALEQERARADATLNPSTWPKLERHILDRAVKSRIDQIVHSGTGILALLGEGKDADVGSAYMVMQRVSGDLGRIRIASALAEYITGVAADLRKSLLSALAASSGAYTPSHDKYVSALLELHVRFRALVAGQLGSDPLIRKRMDTAFNVTVNTNPGGERDPHPTGELVAVFLDAAMRGKRGGTKVTEEEISGIVADVHELFLLLNDKDLFQDSHRTLLSKRLLAESSVSNAMELEFIAKLKESQGPTYTAKFEGMLTDLTSPDAATKAFRSAVAGKAWDFDVRTLCHGHWPPAYATGKVTLPRALKDAVAEFSEYYREKQSSRKLDFALADGTMTVRGHFRGKGKAEWVDLRCSTLQGLLLLLFNSAGEWTAKDLSAAAGLELQDTAKLLHPLIFSGACRVLVDKTLADDHKAGKKIAKKVEGHHRLLFNGKFTSKRRAVGVPSVQLKKTFNKGALDLGRQHVLDAAIVRVMKARKAMRLNALVVEVETQVKRLFSADPRVTKKRIEHLIDQDYLERDESDRSKLTYVA